MRKRTASSI